MFCTIDVMLEGTLNSRASNQYDLDERRRLRETEHWEDTANASLLFLFPCQRNDYVKQCEKYSLHLIMERLMGLGVEQCNTISPYSTRHFEKDVIAILKGHSMHTGLRYILEEPKTVKTRVVVPKVERLPLSVLSKLKASTECRGHGPDLLLADRLSLTGTANAPCKLCYHQSY